MIEKFIPMDFSDMMTNFISKSILFIMTAFLLGEAFAYYYHGQTLIFLIPLIVLTVLIFFTSLEDLISLEWAEFIQEPITLILIILTGSFVLGEFYFIHFMGEPYVSWPLYLYIFVLGIRLVRELLKET